MNDGNVPVTLEVPIEVVMQDAEEREKDSAYETLKQAKIQKEYDNPRNSKYRKVVDYLKEADESRDLTLQKIADDLMISEATVKTSITKSNFWNGNSMTWIPVPKKAGTIQRSGRNLNQYKIWDIKKQRTITSMGVVKDKAEHTTSDKLKEYERELAIKKAMEEDEKKNEAKREDKKKLVMIQ